MKAAILKKKKSSGLIISIITFNRILRMDPRTIFNYNFLQDPFGILTNLDNEKKDLSEVDEALSKLILLYFS